MGPKRSILENFKDSHKIIKNPPLAQRRPLVQPPPPQLNQQEPSQPPPLQPHQQEPSQPPPLQAHQQEPSQPPPLQAHQQEPSQPPPLQAHQQEPSQQPQQVTGLASTSTTLSSSSPSTSQPATENANISNEVGFVGGVETEVIEGLSDSNDESSSPSTWVFEMEDDVPTSEPSIYPDFSSSVASTDPQDGYYSNQQRHQQEPPIPHGGPPERPVLTSQTTSTPSEVLGGNNIMSSPAMGELMTGAGARDGQPMGFGQQDLVGRAGPELLHVPTDASNTLFVEGLPSGCSRREVAHIFRQCVGYRKVRFVTKKHRNGETIVHCFVDFDTHACAEAALNALQGYRMDEEEPDSKILRLEFSRNQGPRPGEGGGN